MFEYIRELPSSSSFILFSCSAKTEMLLRLFSIILYIFRLSFSLSSLIQSTLSSQYFLIFYLLFICISLTWRVLCFLKASYFSLLITIFLWLIIWSLFISEYHSCLVLWSWDCRLWILWLSSSLIFFMMWLLFYCSFLLVSKDRPSYLLVDLLIIDAVIYEDDFAAQTGHC